MRLIVEIYGNLLIIHACIEVRSCDLSSFLLQNVSNNFIRSEGAEAFASMLEANTTLKTLSLQGKYQFCFVLFLTHRISWNDSNEI